MSDPREYVASEQIACQHIGSGWLIFGRLGDDLINDWPEVVAFARAIIGADAEWRESKLMTVEELRTAYPTAYFAITGSNAGYSGFFSQHRRCVAAERYADFERYTDALEWLNARAAELARLEQ